MQRGSDDIIEVLISRTDKENSNTTFLGSKGIFVVPASGQWAYAEVRVISLSSCDGERYSCFGLATEDMKLESRCLATGSHSICWEARKSYSLEKGRLASSLRGVWDVEENDELFFKDGDNLGLLVECSTEQPMVHFFKNRLHVHASPILEEVFNKRLFPAFSVDIDRKLTPDREIEIILDPYPPHGWWGEFAGKDEVGGADGSGSEGARGSRRWGRGLSGGAGGGAGGDGGESEIGRAHV